MGSVISVSCFMTRIGSPRIIRPRPVKSKSQVSIMDNGMVASGINDSRRRERMKDGIE